MNFDSAWDSCIEKGYIIQHEATGDEAILYYIPNPL